MVRVATLLAPLAVAFGIAAAASIGCNNVEAKEAPDAALPPCDQGPFAFPGALSPDQTTTPACSADDNANLPVIALLPRGGRYGVGTKVNYVGTRDLQGDCKLDTVCTCVVSEQPTVQPITDAGADADADAAPPAPAPPTPGTPKWTCQ